MPSSSYLAFLAASLVLALIPGPGVIYIVTRTLQGGRRAGLASIGGIALGNFGNASLASIGLVAVIATSTRAFLLVKIAGAAYLIFLGIKALRRRPESLDMGIRAPAPESGARLFRDGFLRRSRWRSYGRYVSAAAFIGLGLYAACASPRAAR